MLHTTQAVSHLRVSAVYVNTCLIKTESTLFINKTDRFEWQNNPASRGPWPPHVPDVTSCNFC